MIKQINFTDLLYSKTVATVTLINSALNFNFFKITVYIVIKKNQIADLRVLYNLSLLYVKTDRVAIMGSVFGDYHLPYT